MKIGGLHKFSLIDFPQKTSAIIFTQGCNFKCPFCHNPELVLPSLFTNDYSEDGILTFLKKRKGLLDGVVITGGEPTIQKDLKQFLKKIKKIGFLIKLDTNGSNPDVLKELINLQLIDYIAMDIKSPYNKYKLLSGIEINTSNIKKSIQIIENSRISYEFRTTVIPNYLNADDLMDIVSYLKDKTKYKIQNFNPSDKIIDETILKFPQYKDKQINDFQNQIMKT